MTYEESYALESFIIMCDEMQIAQEGFDYKTIIHNIKTALVNFFKMLLNAFKKNVLSRIGVTYVLLNEFNALMSTLKMGYADWTNIKRDLTSVDAMEKTLNDADTVFTNNMQKLSDILETFAVIVPTDISEYKKISHKEVKEMKDLIEGFHRYTFDVLSKFTGNSLSEEEEQKSVKLCNQLNQHTMYMMNAYNSAFDTVMFHHDREQTIRVKPVNVTLKSIKI